MASIQLTSGLKMNRMINLLLSLLCLAYWPIRGRAKQAPAKIKRVLVFRSKPHVGDMVYITPLFAAIKKTYPAAAITLVAGGRVEEVVRHNPDIAELIHYRDNFWATWQTVRQLKPDFACLVNLGSIEGLALLYLSGTKCISVLSWNEAGVSWLYNTLKKLVVAKPFARGQYVPPLYLTLLDPIAANTGDVHFRLYFSPEAGGAVKKVLTGRQIDPARDLLVGIAPGGSTKDRWWPAGRYAELVNWLTKNYQAKIILIGAGIDQEAINEVIAGLKPETAYVNFYNQSLDEFKATIAKLHLMIGNDSGPMVTADAFDVPQMIFIGPTDEREYHLPPNPLYRILKASNNKVDSISLETATKELKKLLDNLNRTNHHNK